ncbi:MAG: PD-(D/E)XK nuclease family protein, partial [Candidatus Zixiibacteriota bacterium]
EKPEVPRRVSADTYMGNAVHNVLAELYRVGSQGVALPLERAEAMYKAWWDKPESRAIEVANENLTVDDYINDGLKMLREFHARFSPFNQGKLFGVEYNIRFRLPGTPFEFTARIDKLWRRDDGVVEICDYKTGRQLPAGAKDSRYRHQMALYQLAVQDRFPDFDDIEVSQYFLRQGEAIRYRFPAEELDELREMFRQEVIASLNATRLNAFPTQEGGYCHYCNYQQLCPAKRHRLLLDKETGADDRERTTAETARELAERFLDVTHRLRVLQSEQKALREDIVQAAKDLETDKLVADSGEIVTRITTQEKFVTKTSDPQQYAELSALARSLGLDECFELNGNILMKEIYQKQRLPEDQLEKLRPFIITSESVRLTPKYREPADDDSD